MKILRASCLVMEVPAELLVCLDAGTGGTAGVDKRDYRKLPKYSDT